MAGSRGAYLARHEMRRAAGRVAARGGRGPGRRAPWAAAAERGGKAAVSARPGGTGWSGEMTKAPPFPALPLPFKQGAPRIHRRGGCGGRTPPNTPKPCGPGEIRRRSRRDPRARETKPEMARRRRRRERDRPEGARRRARDTGRQTGGARGRGGERAGGARRSQTARQSGESARRGQGRGSATARPEHSRPRHCHLPRPAPCCTPTEVPASRLPGVRSPQPSLFLPCARPGRLPSLAAGTSLPHVCRQQRARRWERGCAPPAGPESGECRPRAGPSTSHGSRPQPRAAAAALPVRPPDLQAPALALGAPVPGPCSAPRPLSAVLSPPRRSAPGPARTCAAG